MHRLLGLLVALALPAGWLVAAPAASYASGEPDFASRVPDRTRQVVRTVRTHRWCDARYCTITQAWRMKRDGTWTKVDQWRSTIGPRGLGKRREGDMRSPRGVYRIKVAFSTRRGTPHGRMPWRQRKPTSLVASWAGRYYNTWLEQPGRTDGNRPSMRWGFVVDYNHPRLKVGKGPRPRPGKGSGIFYHTSKPGARWKATQGCTQVGNPAAMRWIVRWLRPGAHPRVVQGS